MSNPLFEEHMKAGFINFLMFRIHLAGLAVITFLVFLFYPSQPASYFLARSVKPEMFNIALYTILAFISYLTIKSAIFNIQNTKIISMDDWFLYTKISPWTFLKGKLFYGLFYSIFLNLLFLPVLLVAGSVSSISPPNLLSIIGFIFLLTLDLYLLGLFFFVIFRKPHWILTLILWVTVILIVFISPNFFPESHPMLLLLKLQASQNPSVLLFMPIMIWLIITTVLTTAICLIVIFYNRRIHD